MIDTWHEGSFGPETWLMDDLDGPLTNNNVEGFHVRVNRWAKKAHPDLFGIVKTCQQLDADMSHKYKQRLNGKPAPALNKNVANKYADLKRMRELLKEGAITVGQFLASGSHIVGYSVNY